ncbi:MAG: Mrp/NBP35 family ATP-binding protein [Desulfovibrio sp.]|jgi:Mrp family chromosome partitioning ATPase|nr:Mrp/NBP35 family ATP-binding protein [Desulfovibrio sp.]
MPSCSSSCPSRSASCPSPSSGGGNCPEGAALQDAAIAATLKGIRHKIFVMSGKGGVGKSSVTVNTAAALADAGYRVGILDVDMHGPSVPNLLGLASSIEADEATGRLLPAPHGDRLSVISMDTLLQDKNQAVLWRGPKKTAAIRQFIADVQWGELDFLLIDSPPGTGDEHMTILKTIPDALCLVVTTPQEISLADVRKALNFLQYAGAAILGLAENMSGLACPHCRRHISLFKSGGGAELAKRHGLRFLGAIPLDPAAVEAADSGLPVVRLEGESPAKEAFLELARAVAAAAEGGQP